jgi:hypothetical protein
MIEIPAPLADEVRRELRGERALWTGVPQRWAYARRKIAVAVFGLPFLAFSIFWTAMAYHGTQHAKAAPDAAFLFPLWGLPFVLIGLSMVLSPLFAAWKAGRVYYAVTETRALIFERVWSTRIESFDLRQLPVLERIARGNGRGDIVLARRPSSNAKKHTMIDIGFIALSDLDAADRALHTARQTLAQR